MDITLIPQYVMNTFCRICAEKSSNLTGIFKIESLPLKIYKCLSIQVNESDNLSLNVCESCFFKIDESYTFYETASQADQKLKKLWKMLFSQTKRNNEKTVVPAALTCDVLFLNESHAGLLEMEEDKLETKISSQLDISIPETKMTCNEVEVFESEKQINCIIPEDIMVIQETIALEVTSQNRNAVITKSNKEENSRTPTEENHQVETSKTDVRYNNGDQKQSTKVYQCQFCSRQLSTLASLRIHESTHSEEKPYLCDTCGKSFKHANNLRSHAQTHLGMKKKYMCKICSKAFVKNFFLQEHMNSHTGDTPYKCLDCGKEFREKVHLRQHKWTHSNKKFICPICGNRFSRKGNMNEHIKKYHKSKTLDTCNPTERKKPKESSIENIHFKCSTCNMNFPNKVLLKNHMKIHPEQKKFCCSLCGKNFRHSGSLTYHRRTTHTGERPFQCSYCNERFSLRSVQQIHERKNHTFEHPYKCTFCSRLFTNSSSLRNHLYVHSKDKLFECDECGKKFSRSSNLFVHKKLHSGDRRFTCDQCGKSYIQKHDMLKHRKVHDPKSKPFFCKYCGNSFSHKRDSLKHATCQFNFVQKNNADGFLAERILDTVTGDLQKTSEDFLSEGEQLILESVKRFSEATTPRQDFLHVGTDL